MSERRFSINDHVLVTVEDSCFTGKVGIITGLYGTAADNLGYFVYFDTEEDDYVFWDSELEIE